MVQSYRIILAPNARIQRRRRTINDKRSANSPSAAMSYRCTRVIFAVITHGEDGTCCRGCDDSAMNGSCDASNKLGRTSSAALLAH